MCVVTSVALHDYNLSWYVEHNYYVGILYVAVCLSVYKRSRREVDSLLSGHVATYVNLYKALSYKFVTKLIKESAYNSSALDNHLARHST